MNKMKLLLKKTYVPIIITLTIFSIIFLIILNKKAMPIIMNYANVQTKRIGIEVLRSCGTLDVNKLLEDAELLILG